jgi:fatty-acyl-CoA synthase
MFRHRPFKRRASSATKDDYRGETVKAVVVLRQPATAGQVSVSRTSLTGVATHMAVYKVPRMVEFVDALPKSGSGKVMWRALQELEGS